MSAQTKCDPLRAANELRGQWASEKRRLAFFGGGTSHRSSCGFVIYLLSFADVVERL
jgi:hypothetical protein